MAEEGAAAVAIDEIDEATKINMCCIIADAIIPDGFPDDRTDVPDPTFQLETVMRAYAYRIASWIERGFGRALILSLPVEYHQVFLDTFTDELAQKGFSVTADAPTEIVTVTYNE